MKGDSHFKEWHMANSKKEVMAHVRFKTTWKDAHRRLGPNSYAHCVLLTFISHSELLVPFISSLTSLLLVLQQLSSTRVLRPSKTFKTLKNPQESRTTLAVQCHVISIHHQSRKILVFAGVVYLCPIWILCIWRVWYISIVYIVTRSIFQDTFIGVAFHFSLHFHLVSQTRTLMMLHNPGFRQGIIPCGPYMFCILGKASPFIHLHSLQQLTHLFKVFFLIFFSLRVSLNARACRIIRMIVCVPLYNNV